MTRRTLAIVLGLGGALLVVAVVVLGRQSGVIDVGLPRVQLGDATAAVLDTVSVRSRVVEASVEGTVTQVDADGQVWLASGGDAFALRFEEPPPLSVEDHVLATGRVRAWRGARWLAVDSWVRVVSTTAPPPGPGL